MDGLIIAEPYISDILNGKKIWEMRSRKTTKRGRIALIRKGSGRIVGYADLVDVLDPLTPSNYSKFYDKHRVPDAISHKQDFKWFTPWVLDRVEKLSKPIAYEHKSGAVTWVKLDSLSTQPPETMSQSSKSKVELINTEWANRKFSTEKFNLERNVIAGLIAFLAILLELVVLLSLPYWVLTGMFSFALFLSCLIGGLVCGAIAGLLDPSFANMTLVED